MLILDDVDYYTTSEESGKFLFNVIKQRYEDHTSTIITSNKTPKAWKNLFGESRTGAALDRLFDHDRAITIKFIDGKSYRVPQPLDELTQITAPTLEPERKILHRVSAAFHRNG